MIDPSPVARCLVLRGRGPRMREVVAKMLDIAAPQRVAAVRTMEDAFVSVQLHTHSCTGKRFDARSEMVEQRLDLAPVDVSADRVVEDRATKVLVLVAHGTKRGSAHSKHTPQTQGRAA